MTNSLKNAAGVCARILLASGITFVVFGAAVLPAAAQTSETQSDAILQVSTSGLDLSKEGDRKVLTYRIGSASGQVCADAGPPKADEAFSDQACATEAFGRAMQQVRQLLAERARERMIAFENK